MKNSRAFTVLEAVITLTIVCILILVGSLQLNNLRSKIVLHSSISEFKVALSQAARVAVIQNEPVKVHYFAKAHELEIISTSFHRKVMFDETLNISQFNNYQISENGMISPKHIVFSDGKNTKAINIQMAWGRVIDEEK